MGSVNAMVWAKALTTRSAAFPTQKDASLEPRKRSEPRGRAGSKRGGLDTEFASDGTPGSPERERPPPSHEVVAVVVVLFLLYRIPPRAVTQK